MNRHMLVNKLIKMDQEVQEENRIKAIHMIEKIIEQPNDFIKTSKASNSGENKNKSQSERLTFWTQFNDEIIAHGKPCLSHILSEGI